MTVSLRADLMLPNKLRRFDTAEAAQRLVEAAPSFTVTIIDQIEFTVFKRVAQFGAVLHRAVT